MVIILYLNQGGLMRIFVMPLFIVTQILYSQIGFINIRVNKDNTTQVQNEQQIAVNPTDSLNFVADWRDFRVGYRQVGHAATFDGGRTWVAETLYVEPTYIWDSDPGMTVDANGNFFAIILSFNSTSEPNGYFVFESTDKGITWSAPRTVINQVPGVFEDKELIACDRTSSPYRGNLYVAWARFYAIDIMLTRSTNQGFNWSAPVNVSDASGSYQWPVPAVGSSGEVYVAWCGPSSILFDRSTNGGTTWGTDRTVQSYSSQSRNVKGSILTFSYPAMDVDITGGPYNGYLYIAYMDNGPDGFPDMYFTRSTDRGQTWSARRRINDDPLNNRIDQFHPWLTVDKTGCISVIFYDSRMDPSNILCDVYLTQSTDGGNTWSSNMRVTNVSSDLRMDKDGAIEPYDPRKPLCGQFAGWIGEYNGLAATSRRNVVPIWTDTRNGNQDTYIGVFQSSGVAEAASAKTRSRLSIKPNPAVNNLLINYDVERPGEYYVNLYNGLGQKLQSIFHGYLAVGNHRFKAGNIVSLPKGVYFIGISGPNAAHNQEFVIAE